MKRGHRRWAAVLWVAVAAGAAATFAAAVLLALPEPLPILSIAGP